MEMFYEFMRLCFRKIQNKIEIGYKNISKNSVFLILNK